MIIETNEPMNWDGTQTVPTLTSRNAGGAQRMPDKENFQAVLYDARGNGDGATAPTITGDHQSRVTDYTGVAVDFTNAVEGEVNGSLQASAEHNTASNNVCREGYIVRRLTPLECERLQGFPDGWTDIGEWVDTKGKKHKPADAPRYKALGNSIAVGYANNCSGFWMWLMKRISAQYERDATLGSLFDGISGFHLAWAHYNGVENCRWSSEIEEFCIAVCKKHFGDEETGEQGDYYEIVQRRNKT